MTLEELIIAVVRVLGSLFVLRWALVGGLIAILVDLSDLFLKNLLSLAVSAITRRSTRSWTRSISVRSLPLPSGSGAAWRGVLPPVCTPSVSPAS